MADDNTKPGPGGDAEEHLPEASLMSHLLELRERLLKAGGSVLLVFLVLLPFAQQVFALVAKPLMSKLPAGATMVATQVASPFLTPFKATFYTAILLAMPLVIYQVWAFVAPGLYRREKRVAVPLLVSSVLLFFVGVAFAYFAIFPVMFGFFTASAPSGVQVMTDINAYLDFVLVLFISFGVAFEVPVAVVLLAVIGVVSVKALAAARRYVFLGAFCISMVLTPPDPFSQTLLALPMYLLYEGGLVMARLLAPGRVAEGASHSA